VSFVQAVFTELQQHLFGNPHSANPSSELTEDLVGDARQMVLDFFGAPPEDYNVVFTRGATSALQMVGESFPWHKNKGEFLYLVRIR
jgi:molybdenum cofactor sulfurtransferase